MKLTTLPAPLVILGNRYYEELVSGPTRVTYLENPRTKAEKVNNHKLATLGLYLYLLAAIFKTNTID